MFSRNDSLIFASVISCAHQNSTHDYTHETRAEQHEFVSDTSL